MSYNPLIKEVLFYSDVFNNFESDTKIIATSDYSNGIKYLVQKNRIDATNIITDIIVGRSDNNTSKKEVLFNNLSLQKAIDFYNNLK